MLTLKEINDDLKEQLQWPAKIFGYLIKLSSRTGLCFPVLQKTVKSIYPKTVMKKINYMDEATPEMLVLQMLQITYLSHNSSATEFVAGGVTSIDFARFTLILNPRKFND